jgi:hypothetical protein
MAPVLVSASRQIAGFEPVLEYEIHWMLFDAVSLRRIRPNDWVLN